jgi:hypothetical protein
VTRQQRKNGGSKKVCPECPEPARSFVVSMKPAHSGHTETTKNELNPMKSKLTSLLAAALLVMTGALHAGDPAPAKKASADFERMKSLVGTWAGKVDMGKGPEDFSVQYRLIAAGSVLEERCFVGSPNEMVTMFYDKDGKLAMTHYCMLGNRPTMTVKSSDAKSISFQLDKESSCIDCAKEAHMNAISLRFDDADTITTSCKAMMEGKEMPEHPTTLKRVASK